MSRDESAAASPSPRPYYEDGMVRLYLGDARDTVTVPWLHSAKYVVVTDPPYPNNAGHFDADVLAAREVLARLDVESLVFWNELEQPPVSLPLVAVHIWHRANVNGRPYEPIYHFAPDGEKRRSCVLRYAVEFENATGGHYMGHPTQKPVDLMRWLIARTEPAIVVDPFAGSGSTLRAAKDLGRKTVGCEIREDYCEIAARRCAQEVLDLAV